MDQLTTIAALPMGPGCLSSLPAEVGKPRKYATGGFVGMDIAKGSDQTVLVTVSTHTSGFDARAMVQKAVADSMRRTLLKIAGATA